MWKLTIDQVVKKEYEGKEYDSPECIVYESEHIEDLLSTVSRLSGLSHAGTVAYVIEKVVNE